MVYRNDDVAALDAMERERLGNYGDDMEEEQETYFEEYEEDIYGGRF